jgi:hypothetical protein
MAKTDEMLINSILPHDLNHGNYGKFLFTHLSISKRNEVTNGPSGVILPTKFTKLYGLVFLTHVRDPTCHQLQVKHNSKQTSKRFAHGPLLFIPLMILPENLENNPHAMESRLIILCHLPNTLGQN